MRLIGAISLFGFAALAAFAQLANQTSLVGTVVDSSGSVVPNAQVVAVNMATRDTYRGLTNAQGYYDIQFIRAGTYEITVSQAGFQTFKAAGIEVDANQIVRTDATLRVGDVTESVTVEASAQVISTDEARVAETLHTRAVAELPVSGRDVWALASTAPGVLSGTSSFIGAGQRSTQNSISLDGVGASQNLLTSTTMRPSIDSVSEVQVQTGSMSAEYGAYLGVRINVITKSGTNSVHGSLFEFLRNDKLDARGFFNNANTAKNPLRRNQFGVEVDGPVYLPKIYDGRNKTFFMGTYEGTRQVSSSTSLQTVMTAKMRDGDFTETPASTVIRNPSMPGSPIYTNKIIPLADQNPIALKIQQYLPLPNLPGLANNLLGVSQSLSGANQGLGRIDQNVGDKVRLYFRYNWEHSTSESDPTIIYNGSAGGDRNRNILVAYTHTLSPHFVNDFRAGDHYTSEPTENYFTTHGLTSAGTDLGIPGFKFDSTDHDPGVPDITISGFSGLSGGGTNWYQNDSTLQLTDVAAWTRGAHSLRFGADVRRLATGRTAVNSPRGILAFNGQIAGYAPAEFLLGLPQTVTTGAPQVRGRVAAWRNGFFVNDTWQVSRKLTVNIGLRYELPTVPYTVTGYQSILNADQTAILPANPPVAGFKLLLNPNHKDWAPRAGLAYRVTSKTVIRSGFGIYYNPNQTNSFTFLNNNPPFSPIYVYTQTSAAVNLTLNNPIPAAGPTGPSTPPNMITPAPTLPDSTMYQWTFDVQRETWKNAALDFQYIGSNTIHLDRSFFNNTPLPGPGAIDPRRPNKNFTVIRTITNDTNASYNALTIGLRQRMSRGLELLAHYTWAHTLDVSSNSNAGERNTQDPYHWWYDHSNSSWDYRHRFVASYVYDLPFFRNTKNAFLKYAIAGWQANGITQIQSGAPFSVTSSEDIANVGIISGAINQRPDRIAPATDNCGRSQLTNCISYASFRRPAQYTYGNGGRNTLVGPGSANTDFSLFKNFAFKEKAKLQFRGEFFDFFNTPHFGNPNSSLTTADLNAIAAGGKPSSAFGSISSSNGNRTVQVGLRLQF
jgi:hypothetical protein